MKNMIFDKIKDTLCFFVILLMGSAFLYACSSDDKELEGEPVLQVQKSIGFMKEGGEVDVTVKSNREWNATVTEGKEWLTARKASDTELTISVTASSEKGVREGNVTITNDALTAKLRVVQTGGDLIVEVAEDSRIVQVGGGGNDNVIIHLLSNSDYEVVIQEDAKSWITQKEAPETRADLASSTRIFSVASNPLTTDRNATIKFVSKADPGIYDVSEIKQRKKSSDASEVNPEKDVKLKVTGGYDTDHQPDSDISKSFDGQFGGTCYHSTWGQSADFPVTLEYQFDGNQLQLDYILYHTRNGNGNFGAFELQIKSQSSSNFVHIEDYDFKGAGGSHKILLKEPVVPAAVRFIVKSGLNDFVSCDEMEFFHVTENPLDQQLTTVFTDLSCSELRSDVSEEAINQLPTFFNVLASSLQANTYPEAEKRFRIQSYKAYSTPEYWGDMLRTNYYSPLCNPTGIITNAGEEMVVLVDGIPQGESISLRCCSDLGPDGEERFLKNGINKFSFTRAGNLFVIYQKLDPRNMPSIKIHFPPQYVETVEHARVGFNVWDLNVDKTDEKFREYIHKAQSVTQSGSDKCIFVLKGRKILFTALKELLQNQDNFKQYGVVRGVERWDNLMDWEQELAAIDTYAKTGEFNSLMHVTTFTDGLYATNYHINMAAGDVNTRDGWGFKNNFDPRDMDKNQDNEWGPGHELGHMHQGAINWPSTTESSNNLFSNYVVYKINQWGSRGSSIGALATYRYAPPTPWVRFMHPRDLNTLKFTPHDMTSDDANKNGLYQGEASEMHMRLNQQLWTYFERIGKKPNTIRKIFEQGRTPEFWLSSNDPGAAQLMYARNVAKAANMDMTEFFDAWGFFIPVETFNLYAYGSFKYTVTQAMIDQTLAYMKTFSTKCPPIEYIEDRKYQAGAGGNQKGVSEEGGDVGYFETFQNNVKITKAVSYTVSGRTFRVTNGDQAVAFELIREGKKLWFANRFVFTVPDRVDIEGAELYAVQADGQRIRANK